MRGKRTYGGRSGQRAKEQGTWASRTRNHSEAGYGRPLDRGTWTAKTVKQPRQQPAQPQYANYRAPLTRKRHTQDSPGTPTTGLRERGNDTSKSTGRSGRQKVATRRNMRREERVTVQGPVKKQQPDGTSHRGLGGVAYNDWARPPPRGCCKCSNQVYSPRCVVEPCVTSHAEQSTVSKGDPGSRGNVPPPLHVRCEGRMFAGSLT